MFLIANHIWPYTQLIPFSHLLGVVEVDLLHDGAHHLGIVMAVPRLHIPKHGKDIRGLMTVHSINQWIHMDGD
jgi:hypothetical protein